MTKMRPQLSSQWQQSKLPHLKRPGSLLKAMQMLCPSACSCHKRWWTVRALPTDALVSVTPVKLITHAGGSCHQRPGNL